MNKNLLKKIDKLNKQKIGGEDGNNNNDDDDAESLIPDKNNEE